MLDCIGQTDRSFLKVRQLRLAPAQPRHQHFLDGVLDGRVGHSEGTQHGVDIRKPVRPAPDQLAVFGALVDGHFWPP